MSTSQPPQSGFTKRQPWEAPPVKHHAPLPPEPDNTRQVRLLVGVLLLMATVLTWELLDLSGEPALTNFADRAADVLPLLELHQLDGGWVGVVDTDWEGLTDTSIAEAACARLAVRMETTPSGTISLFDVDGMPVVECQP